MDYHPITKEITNLLAEKSIWFETFEHEEVHTSEEAAKTRPGYTLNQGAKAIIAFTRKNKKNLKYIMLVVPADKRLDSKKIKNLLKIKDIRFATEDEVNELTKGVKFGGIPPFGHLFGLQTIVDPQLFTNEKIVFNAGDRCFSLAMYSKDYKLIESPELADIIQQ